VKYRDQFLVSSIAAMILLSFFAAPAEAAIELKATDRSLLELCALILGGIGIFLIGIHFAGEHLQQMAGGRFEKIVGGLVTRYYGVVSIGTLLGFLTQSGKAAAFILSDLVSVKLLSTRQAGLVVFWGNVGCTLIVFASMLSLKVFALIVLGITALGLTFHIPKQLVKTYGALFGMAMIMYGLFLVKDGAGGIASAGWVPEFIEALRGTYLLSFIAGLTLTLLIQSNLAVMMISIALASSGLLTLPETAAVMYGAQAGTGILTYIFSFHAKGLARQVVAYQIAFDLFTTVFFVTLFVIEMGLGVPLLLAAVEAIFSQLSTQTVMLALVFQTIGAVLLTTLRRTVYARVEYFFPPSKTESLSEAEFVHKDAHRTPELGLLLIKREQNRLLHRLPAYLEYARNPSAKGATHPQHYHLAFNFLSRQINSVLYGISKQNLNESLAEDLISATKEHEQLVNLEDLLHQIALQIAGYHQDNQAKHLGEIILESVDFLILTAVETIESGDQEDIATLASLTQDRSEMMANFRKAYFGAEQSLDNDARSYVLDITLLVESVVKSLSRYGQLLLLTERSTSHLSEGSRDST